MCLSPLLASPETSTVCPCPLLTCSNTRSNDAREAVRPMSTGHTTEMSNGRAIIVPFRSACLLFGQRSTCLVFLGRPLAPHLPQSIEGQRCLPRTQKASQRRTSKKGSTWRTVVVYLQQKGDSIPRVPYLHEFAQVASWTILVPANLSSPLVTRLGVATFLAPRKWGEKML